MSNVSVYFNGTLISSDTSNINISLDASPLNNQIKYMVNKNSYKNSIYGNELEYTNFVNPGVSKYLGNKIKVTRIDEASFKNLIKKH